MKPSSASTINLSVPGSNKTLCHHSIYKLSWNSSCTTPRTRYCSTMAFAFFSIFIGLYYRFRNNSITPLYLLFTSLYFFTRPAVCS
jgi:hypothetical protein